MCKLKELAEEHFRCDAEVLFDAERTKITIEIYTDLSPKDFRKRRRDFYRVLRGLTYRRSIDMIDVVRGIREDQIHE